MLKAKKILCCFAFGGLNDVICQTLKAIQYCKKTKRYLILDSNQSRIECDIFKYFDLEQDGILLKKVSSPNIVFEYTSSGVRSVRGDFYKVDYEKKYKNYFLINANNSQTCDDVNSFFKITRMKQPLLNCIKSRYKQLPKNYTSVHVRNTDYSSDILSFLENNKDKLARKNIFLASDNTETLDYLTREFESLGSVVFSFSNIPKFDHSFEGGIHKYKVKDKNQLNIDAIADLVLLSLSENYYFAPSKSWYSLSAKKMHEDNECRTKILNQLIE